jgi:hypothetical protein
MAYTKPVECATPETPPYACELGENRLQILSGLWGSAGLAGASERRARSTQPAPGRNLLRQPYALSCAKIEHEMNHIRANECGDHVFPGRCPGLKAALALRAGRPIESVSLTMARRLRVCPVPGRIRPWRGRLAVLMYALTGRTFFCFQGSEMFRGSTGVKMQRRRRP